MAQPVPARLTAAELRKFGLLVGGVFVALGGLFWWRDSGRAAAILWGVGGPLMALGLAAPALLRPVYRAWMGLALLISRVTTPVIMAVLYFVVMTPVGLLARAFGHRPLERGGKDRELWLVRQPADRKSDMERQF